MEDALIESSQQMEDPQTPVAPGTTFESDEPAAELGVLRIKLAEVIPAGVLAKILCLLDDVYNTRAWLSLANSATPENPIPDEYHPEEEQVMHISRMEIGTTNFIELFGQMFKQLPHPVHNLLSTITIENLHSNQLFLSLF